MSLSIEFKESIQQISPDQWNACFSTDYPFIRHEFLLALEESGATTLETGWEVKHTAVYDGKKLVAAMPTYRKHHSYGEYVFDFQWASAFHRHGIPYYPKLLTAIPFTPVAGPRLGICQNADQQKITQKVVDHCKQYVSEHSLSSWHVIFAEKKFCDELAEFGLLARTDIQFQWANQDYKSFSDYLESCNSRHRKKIKKERKSVQQQGIHIEWLEGSSISEDIWKQFHTLYQMTYLKRSGHGGYLNDTFFSLLGSTMSENIVLAIARVDNQIVAASLFFKDSQRLYGRYWGCLKEYDYLHFELCYYSGIAYCIDNQLIGFESGAQGEHKIQRGFEPQPTWSSHWIADAEFRAAIKEFLAREQIHIQSYKEQAKQLLPFRKDQ